MRRGRSSRRPGVYAVIPGGHFAGASNAGEPVRDLADQAVDAKRGEGATAIVLDFIDRVADRRSGGGERDGGSDPGGDVSGTGLLGLLALLGLGGVTASVISRRRRRREEQAQLQEVKT